MDKQRRGYVYLDVHDPLVAWLVCRGELVSAPQLRENALSFWAAGRLRDRRSLEQELEIERVRQRDFPAAVSRLLGFYIFPDEDSAHAAQSWELSAFCAENLAAVSIDPRSRVSRYDAEWITENVANVGGVWISRYLNGEATDAPIWELVVDGRAVVLGAEVRERAYETVKREWPDTLGMLELARVAVEVRSDLGVITAALTQTNSGLLVDYFVKFDANDPEFLRRLEDFGGPKNTHDLNANTALVVPDLRGRRLKLV